MNRFIAIFGILLITQTSLAQIEITKKKEDDRKKEQRMKDDVEKEIVKKKKQKKPLEVTGRNIYIGMTPGQSFRSLKPAETIFGKELGPKADEKPLFTIRYQAGMQVVLFKNFLLDFGFTYTVQGEKYNYSDPLIDSNYSYINKYRYIGVPVTAGGIFGGKWVRFYFSAGIAPLIFINQYQKEVFAANDGSSFERENKYKTSDYNGFNLMAIGKLGIQVNFHKHVGFYAAPEFRYLTINTFQKQYQHVHHQWAWGVDFGFLLYL